jgi:chromosome segregation ATPase
MNPPKSPTPRTDKEEWTAGCGPDSETVVWSDFARTLERELTAAQAECERLKDEILAIGAKPMFYHPQSYAATRANEIQQERQLNELARLRAQLAAIEEDGTEEHNAAVGLRQKLVAALDRAEKAEAERAALAKDKARLDWMLENVGKHYSPMCHDRAAIAAFL